MKAFPTLLVLTTVLLSVLGAEQATVKVPAGQEPSVKVSTGPEPPVKVSVYYLSTDKESVNFVTQQLYPTYIELNKRVSIRDRDRLHARLVPFEDADDQAALTSKCGGQPTRCLVNKIHSCAVARLNNDWNSLNYINCLMTLTHTKSKECATHTCNDVSTMPSCVNTIDGDEYMIANSNETKRLSVPLKSYPIVTFNGVYNGDEQAQARSNLLALLCKKFPSNFEGFCDSPRAKKTMDHNNFGTGFFFPREWQCYYQGNN